MATKVLAGMAAVQIVSRVSSSASASFRASDSCSLCFFASGAAAARRAAAAGLLLPDRSLRRWPGVRNMSRGDADSAAAEEKRRMPARLAQKQQLLDAAPAYADDANGPVPKVSIGMF